VTVAIAYEDQCAVKPAIALRNAVGSDMIELCEMDEHEAMTLLDKSLFL
jgi:hypothetical protein